MGRIFSVREDPCEYFFKKCALIFRAHGNTDFLIACVNLSNWPEF